MHTLRAWWENVYSFTVHTVLLWKYLAWRLPVAHLTEKLKISATFHTTGSKAVGKVCQRRDLSVILSCQMPIIKWLEKKKQNIHQLQTVQEILPATLSDETTQAGHVCVKKPIYFPPSVSEEDLFFEDEPVSWFIYYKTSFKRPHPEVLPGSSKQ